MSPASGTHEAVAMYQRPVDRGHPLLEIWMYGMSTTIDIQATDNAAARNSGRSAYAPGVLNANWFGLFNSASWVIALGTPAVLYAKSQGASATVLGILTSLTPLLVILQIPAAHYLPRYGYRRFVLAGWGSRTVCIFALAVIPLLTFLTPTMRLSLVLLAMFIFNFFRGMASGAWLPWISEIIPDDLRGRFLARDQIFAQVGVLVALGASAAALRSNPAPWQFSLVFLLSAAAATLSLWFLTRMPDVTAKDKLRRSGHRVPWKEMLFYPPFLRLLIFNMLYMMLGGGLGVFTVTYLKGQANWPEGRILWLSTVSVVGALATLPWAGRFLERHGSRRALRMCLVLLAMALVGWWLVASRLMAPAAALIAGFNLLIGIAGVNFTVANSQLMMATMPLMGRNHFFALFSVLTSLALGISPIAWGVLLDSMGDWHRTTGEVYWGRYSVYFALLLAMCAAIFSFTPLLHEKHKPRGSAPASPT